MTPGQRSAYLSDRRAQLRHIALIRREYVDCEGPSPLGDRGKALIFHCHRHLQAELEETNA